MEELGKTCKELKCLVWDRSEWQKRVCAFTLQWTESKGEAHNVYGAPNL